MTDGIFRHALGEHGRCTEGGAGRDSSGGPEGLVLAGSAKGMSGRKTGPGAGREHGRWRGRR